MRNSYVKTVDSTLVEVFTFAKWLDIAETLTSASVTAVVYSGNDSSPSAILSGSPTIAGGEVSQSVVGGVLGTVYMLRCTALTSGSQTLVADLYLAVVPLENA